MENMGAAGIAVAGLDRLDFRFSHMPFAAAVVRKSWKK